MVSRVTSISAASVGASGGSPASARSSFASARASHPIGSRPASKALRAYVHLASDMAMRISRRYALVAGASANSAPSCRTVPGWPLSSRRHSRPGSHSKGICRHMAQGPQGWAIRTSPCQ
eukprot:scaffold552_cov526-Prasinococcus_capsulatus_cf.AAC.35